MSTKQETKKAAPAHREMPKSATAGVAVGPTEDQKRAIVEDMKHAPKDLKAHLPEKHAHNHQEGGAIARPGSPFDGSNPSKEEEEYAKAERKRRGLEK
jgi:hypothetical protein